MYYLRELIKGRILKNNYTTPFLYYMTPKVYHRVKKISRIIIPPLFYPHIKKLFLRFKPYLPWNIREHLKIISFYSQFINKGDLVFDIGANIGDFTKHFLRMKAKAVSVEPQITCVRELYKRFGKNKRVVIVGKALGEKEDISTISVCANANSISTLSEKWKKEGRFFKNHKWTHIQKVQITTLDCLIESYGLPKFCKIDVEGFEVEVLNGISQRIPVICFEFTKEFIDDALTCMTHLESLGNAKFNFVKAATFKFTQPQWTPPEKLFEILKSIPDNLLYGDIYVKFVK